MSNYLPIPEAGDTAELVDLVCSRGFGVLRGGGPEALERALHALGEVFFVYEVRSRPDSPALVASNSAFLPHTDNHRARWAAWLCEQQAERGGHSLVLDGLEVLSRLDEDQQRALAGVRLLDPRASSDEAKHHEMLTRSPGGRMQIYFGHLLVDDTLTSQARAAYDAFSRAIGEVQVYRSLLRSGDILVVDNHRALHGRAAFEGSTSFDPILAAR